MPRARVAARGGRRAVNILQRRVVNAYTSPGHPIAYSAPAAVAKYFGISKNQATHILEHADGYTLHREFKRPSQFNPYYTHNRRKQCQADLIDIARISNQNDGVNFLLLIIDIFTKKIWLYPLRRKSAIEMKRAMQMWVNSLQVKPDRLSTDFGLEFRNRQVQFVLRSNGIVWEPATGTMKAAIAERANKTIQILIYKYLSDRETLRYIDVLPQLVTTYNTRPHRTLEGMTPDFADRPNNEAAVQAVAHRRYAEIGRARKKPKFKVGDVVRVKTDPHKVSQNRRAYAEQFGGEYFTICRINRTLPIPMYYLRSMNTDDEIEGAFYAEELQRQRGDVWKVEQVLNERTRRGVREVLVKWKYFDARHNSWIPRRNIVRRF